MGDVGRSTTAGGPAPADRGSVAVHPVRDPSDLTGLGIALTDITSGWADDGNRIVACFHSLSTLLQYADTERAFRFLHLLTGRFRSVGALAHYHMDPGAHDEQTKNTLVSLFDAVVEVDDDGRPVVVSP